MSWRAGCPPLPARMPGGGRAGYRVFAANGSPKPDPLAPEGGMGPSGPRGGCGVRKGTRVATAGKRSRVLIGRASELAELDRGLDRLGAGKPWFVQIVGEPGIGKSRLLLELTRRASARGYLVLAGRAAEFEQDLPFAVLRDACNDYLGSIERRLRLSLRPETLSELAAVFRSLSGSATMPAARQDLGDDRYRTHYAIRALLEWLAAQQPTVMALDDVHWADAASVEVIAHLLRRFRGPVLGALAARQRRARFAAVLDTATRADYGGRIELAPLTVAQAESLMDPALDADERAILHRQSGGNPFYLEQLSRVAVPAGSRYRLASDNPADEWRPPAAVSASIREELSALSTGTRLTVDAAAI